jgi:hypothetical protein
MKRFASPAGRVRISLSMAGKIRHLLSSFPSVQHADLFGTTLHGAPLSERIRPR